jgi:hypothetical protein
MARRTTPATGKTKISVSGLLPAAPSTHSTVTIVAHTRPTGPSVVALFSHRDQWGTWPLVWIGVSTNSPGAQVGGRGVSSRDGS